MNKKFNLMFAVFLVSAVLMVSLVSASWLTGNVVKVAKNEILAKGVVFKEANSNEATIAVEGKDVTIKEGASVKLSDGKIITNAGKAFWSRKTKFVVTPAPVEIKPQPIDDVPTDQTGCGPDQSINILSVDNIEACGIDNTIQVNDDMIFENSNLQIYDGQFSVSTKPGDIPGVNVFSIYEQPDGKSTIKMTSDYVSLVGVDYFSVGVQDSISLLANNAIYIKSQEMGLVRISSEEIDLQGNVKIDSLTGTGNAYACLDSNGVLYRSLTSCI